MSAEATAKILGLADDTQAEYAAAHVNTQTGEIIEPLTADEAARLRVKESAIERGADEVARALSAIRDERLYRADYTTFEAYCRERWGMTHRHVNRQIVAAEVAEALGPIGPSMTESQARELADLRDRPDELRDTYQRVVEATGGNVTAAAIRDARRPNAPAPMTEGEAEVGTGQTPAASTLPPSGAAGTYSSGADAVGATAPEVLTPAAGFEEKKPHGGGSVADGSPTSPRPQVSPLEAIVRDHEQNSTSAWRKRFAAEMARSGDLFRNVPADVAEHAGPELLELLEQHIAWANDWHGRVQKAQPNRLTVINGGSR